MKSILFNFLNPINWIKAYFFNRDNSKFDKSAYDLELYLYSKILKNDMLHYGYFEDINIGPETISIKQLEDAQIKYSENIIEQIASTDEPIIDVGCGMGGLSFLMQSKGYNVEALTPNNNQIEYINAKYKNLTCHNCKLEDFKTDKKFGTIINSESLQYITLDKAFEKAGDIILSNGRWIIVDYFRFNKNGINKSSHMLEDFLQHVKNYGWTIVYSKDITLNVLPTIKFANMFLERFFLPLKHYAFEKLRYKKGWLYYMTREIRLNIDNKIIKEKASVDPIQFVNEKKYMLFVLEKNKI